MALSKEFGKLDIQDIMAWCEKNNQIEWLKREAAKKETKKVYPRMKKIDENGNVVLNSKGNPVYIADKSKPARTVTNKISFVTLKTRFCEKFMPELLPEKKAKKETFHDLIAKL